MSLKAFHIFFVSSSLILGTGFAAWCFRTSAQANNSFYLLLGVLSLLCSVALAVYLGWFMKKIKNLGA